MEPSEKSFMLGQQSGGAPRSTDQPAPTVATDAQSPGPTGHHRVLRQSYARAVDAPLSVITSMNKHGLVKATLVEYYGRSAGADIDEPLPTVTTKARHGLVDPVLVEVNHGNGRQGRRGDDRRSHPVDQPLGSLTTTPGIGWRSRS